MLTNTPATEKDRPRLVPAPVVAELLSLPLPSVYAHARTRQIPGVVRVGRRVLFDLEKVEAWVDAGGSRG